MGEKGPQKGHRKGHWEMSQMVDDTDEPDTKNGQTAHSTVGDERDKEGTMGT
jgi:hypothetical protein